MSPARIAGLALTIVILASCVDKPDHGPAHITGSTTSITSGTSWYASPNGSWGAAGTQSNPWSLDYALSNSNGTLQPGDTVWLLPGTYNAPNGLSYSADKIGASGSPIVYREHSSGHAIVNARIQNRGSYLTFWGFELTQTSHDALHDSLYGIESYGPGATYINLVIHDANKSGMIIYRPNGDSKVYGCIFYNNGNHTNLDHGIYVQNSTGIARIEQNAVFDNLAYGIHAYMGPSDPTLHGIQLVDNVGFNNGTISTSYPAKGNIIVGGDNGGANGILVEENYMHFSGTDGDNITVGYHGNDQDMKTDYNRILGDGSI